MTTLNDKIQQFINNHPRGNFFQTEQWGRVKSLHDWSYEQIVIENDGEVQAVCTVLFRKVPRLPFTIAYAPRGYVGNYEDKELAKKVISEIKKVAKKRKAIVFYIEPNLARNELPEFNEVLFAEGFKHEGREKDNYLQTRYDGVVFFDENIADSRNQFMSKTKNLLSKAEKAPLEIVYGTDEHVKYFTKLSDETAERNGISLRNNEYYEAILSIFKETNDADLLLVKLDKEKFITSSENRLKPMRKEIKVLDKKIADGTDEEKVSLWKNEQQSKLKRITSIEEDIEKVKSSNEDIYLSGCLIIYSGDRAYYLYAASSNDFRYLEPNILMNYRAMEDAKKRGCTSYNLLGFHEIGDNLYKFKTSLGADAVEYEGLFSLALNKPLFYLFNLAKRLRK